MDAARTRQAFVIALAGFCSLSIGDALVKSMAGAWPAPAVAALRYAFGAAGLALYVALSHGRAGFVMPRAGLQVGRGAAVALATLCFFLGVMAMPLADATAIQFTSPILTALLAPLVLGERTHRTTWIATLLAFAGVLVVLRPNLLEIGPAALFPLGAAFGMSWLMMLNRMTAGAAPVMVMQFLLAAVAAPLLVAAAILFHLAGYEAGWPAPEVVAKCLGVAVFATLGHTLIFAAVARASASLVAPMTYVQLLVAAALGWLWFGDALDSATFAGAALIIGGGLLLWRAQRVRDLGEAPR
ncbi:MAG: DMT family transporter [Allosphingosinicella sp.]